MAESYIISIDQSTQGTSKEVFDYYGLNAEGIVNKAKEILK